MHFVVDIRSGDRASWGGRVLVERNKRNRNAFLCRLYKEAGGDKYKRVSIQKLGEELGLTYKDAVRVTTELRGLVEIDGGAAVVRLTDSGILAAEAILSTPASPTEYPLVDTTASLQQQLLQYQHILDKLKLQEARYGPDVFRQNRIEDIEKEIVKLNAKLGCDL